MSVRRWAGVLSVALGGLIGTAPGVWAHGLGARAGTAEEVAAAAKVYTTVRSVAANPLARARAAAEGRLSAESTAAAVRPNAVDNSTLAAFPPIGDQGEQNSCVAWAAGYYYNTYTQAMDEGLDVSHGDRSHTCSPSFLYPLLNDGADQGAYGQAAMELLNVTGCSSLSVTPYTERDTTTWPAEQAWVEALSRRTKTASRITDHTETGLEAVKQLLANGRVAVVMIDAYANLSRDYPSGGGTDGEVLYAAEGPWKGGHAVTLVGYDDSKSYVDARDGYTYKGALLAANSWGSTWGATNSTGSSKGFLWIADRAFLENKFVFDVLCTDDRPHYQPTAYALVGIDATDRSAVDLGGGAGLPSSPTGTLPLVLHKMGGSALGMTRSQRVAVDLTDLAPSFPGGRLADVFVSLKLAAGTTLTASLVSAEFLADGDGDGTDESAGAPDLPVKATASAAGYAFLPLFDDVNWDYWNYTDVEACFTKGVVSGYADGSYAPKLQVTRDQMAVYISRALAGSDAAVPAGPATPTFSDVPVVFWAYRYVEYAASRGVVQGFADGSYEPANVVDRRAMAVYVARAMAGSDSAVPEPETGAVGFTDVASDFWAYRHIAYLQQAGVASGYADGTYHPEYVVTRDLMATYIARAFKLSA